MSYGRGRGRGGGLQVRDADGNVMVAATGEPPLFPTVDRMPEAPQIDEADLALLVRRHRLESKVKKSCYFLELPKDSQGVAVDIARYSDRYTRMTAQPERQALHTFMKFEPKYFPAELLPQGRGRGRGRG
eukprot:CAMPEP_0170140550 /NCGR_PEP_ID=MMETSP0033_2-20121228/6424_1 /TAXON_ID=195969 /ORGANISM="Dolichomastix tenuilepis, Strain CCMP3274" /LENGTH=129 /DNA_ID=CAMNT_0010376763 /DNA_START=14 /DNA_END=399 /DNA_ORIENTATION=-